MDAAPAVSPASFWVPEDLCASAWTQHAPFAFWLVDVLRPRSFVELGTHNGYSFFAICQAVERLGLGTTAYAVDTWRGDEHAGFYDETVFRSVTQRNARYAGFATLVRSTFDEALPYFADRSIDLLHIDGRHGYEDVRHDYQSWMPKLSAGAVVMFHDINVRERGFGVWRFFDELSAARRSFRFVHGHGLGILLPGSETPPGLASLVGARPETAETIRAVYAALGSALTARQSLAQREDEAAALRSVLADHQGVSDAALGQVRRILGLGSPPAALAQDAGRAPGAIRPTSDGDPKREPRRPRKPRIIAEGRAVPRRP